MLGFTSARLGASRGRATLREGAEREGGLLADRRAGRTGDAWGLSRLRVAYGLDLATARRWGLYISRGKGPTSAGIDEPGYFSEPALYLIRADGTLYFGSVQAMPFARPHFSDILGAIDYVIAKDYPARGEVENLKQAEG